ncbi:MAG TPA: phosphate signaling complex protein PhoU [Planctomycetaceae bacterium]|nr:phosphate signaling complex protein PhoU [Planctomycetaceae bacterium]
MSIHLNRDLESLHQHIMSMCAVVEEVVHRAVDELGRPDVDVSQEIVDRDDEIDRWDVRIEEECLKILALHQPVADNLRRVAAVMKIAWELERVADVAVNIAERAAGLAGAPEILVPEKLSHMAQAALDMLRLSLDAFVAQDSRLAREVCGQDDVVDALNREIIEELLQMMKRSPDLIEPALQLFSASRHVERVADHATNIAEDVVYLVEGEIIRHRAEFWKQ